MSIVGKKHRKAYEHIEGKKISSCREGIDAVLESKYASFDESVDAAVVLGIDPAKGEQTVRGSVLLPHGIGKTVKVLVFAKGDHAKIALDAGADLVGSDDLIEKIQDGYSEFDAAVATPDMMGLVSKVARILGPRGLLPNIKTGTVTFDISSIVKDLKKGRVSFRNDKGGVVHAPFGKASFGSDRLHDNLKALIKAIQVSKPPTVRGKFLRKLFISSTMGIGVELYPDEML